MARNTQRRLTPAGRARRRQIWLPWLMWGCLATAHADTLDQIRARMQIQGAVQLSYVETRRLELMSEPWRGRGFLIAAAPDTLVKLQLQPQREIMAAYDRHMVYYDAARELRRSAAMRDDDPIGLQILAFQAIVHGDFAKLERHYALSFRDSPDGWRLELDPKPDRAALDLARIRVEGRRGQGADLIVLTQADGDLSELRLEKTDEGEALNATVARLLEEALGN